MLVFVTTVLLVFATSAELLSTHPKNDAAYREAIHRWKLTTKCSANTEQRQGQGGSYELTPTSHLLTRIGARLRNLTDKIPMSTVGLPTRKPVLHSYSEFYGPFFERQRHRVQNMIEIGVRGGGSLLMWQRFFPNAQIWGMDIRDGPGPQLAAQHGVKVGLGSAYNVTDVQHLVGDTQFDIIIDDGSHRVFDQADMFNLWKDYVKPGGFVIVEDIQSLENARFIVQAFVGDKRRMTIVDRTHTVPSYCDERLVLYMA